MKGIDPFRPNEDFIIYKRHSADDFPRCFPTRGDTSFAPGLIMQALQAIFLSFKHHFLF